MLLTLRWVWTMCVSGCWVCEKWVACGMGWWWHLPVATAIDTISQGDKAGSQSAGIDQKALALALAIAVQHSTAQHSTARGQFITVWVNICVRLCLCDVQMIHSLTHSQRRTVTAAYTCNWFVLWGQKHTKHANAKCRATVCLYPSLSLALKSPTEIHPPTQMLCVKTATFADSETTHLYPFPRFCLSLSFGLYSFFLCLSANFFKGFVFFFLFLPSGFKSAKPSRNQVKTKPRIESILNGCRKQW